MDDTQIQKKNEGKEKKQAKEKITRDDWETARKQFSAMVINSRINLEAQEYMLEKCMQELNKFSEEDEEMPEDIKSMMYS